MPFCPSCRGIGKSTQTKTCNDCDGKGIVTEKMFKFIEFYKNKKVIQMEINNLEHEVVEECRK